MSARTRRTPVCALRRCTAGATAVEFALVGPVFIALLMGIVEFSVALFIGASIENAMLDAARYQTIGKTDTDGRMAAIHTLLSEKTYGLLDMDDVDVEAKVYSAFGDIGAPEPFTDRNGNGSHDRGEPFTDINGNGVWDADRGADGLGNGNDIVLFTVRYTWGYIVPFIQNRYGEGARFTSSIAVRNEPF